MTIFTASPIVPSLHVVTQLNSMSFHGTRASSNPETSGRLKVDRRAQRGESAFGYIVTAIALKEKLLLVFFGGDCTFPSLHLKKPLLLDSLQVCEQ